VSVEPENARATERALAEALAERNRLWAELNERRVDQAELEYLRRELDAIHRSAMWKVARRYRRLKQLVGTALERLRQG
jgi:hypothetical protein